MCTSCHDETEIYPVLAIGKTRHGVMADKNAPTCTTCHGESKSHLNIPKGEKDRPKPDRLFGMRPTIPAELQVERYFGLFGKNTTTPVAERNAPCLECHQGDERIHWAGSAHEAGDVACTSCHQIHTTHDRARDKHAQTEMCFACHKEQRAQMNRPSRHPITEGKVACSDCHNPHGTAGPKLLVRDNVNDTCYTVPHGEARAVRALAPAGAGGLLDLPQPARHDESQPAQGAQPLPVPVVPRADLASFDRAGGRRGGRREPEHGAGGDHGAWLPELPYQIHGSNNPVDGTGRGFRR